jgi:hypothetical protein
VCDKFFYYYESEKKTGMFLSTLVAEIIKNVKRNNLDGINEGK